MILRAAISLKRPYGITCSCAEQPERPKKMENPTVRGPLDVNGGGTRH